MVREIVRDESFLALPSSPATSEDAELCRDLLDTLAANKERCVGMAANMIGESKRIIVFEDGKGYTLMLNPLIIKKSQPYEAEEACLSLDGLRKTKRFNSIKVEYCNEKMQLRYKSYTGWTAQIIQHEIDHCDGIII